MLEAPTVSKLNDAYDCMKKFISEKEKRKSLMPWLDWWVSKKNHIFRSCKRQTSPESNLAEVIHSGCLTSLRTHLTLVEACTDDIAQWITISSMVKCYGSGSFPGGTGPSFLNLQKRASNRQSHTAASIAALRSSSSELENDGENYESEDASEVRHEKLLTKSNGGGYSPTTNLRKRKGHPKQKKKGRKKIKHISAWQSSDTEVSENDDNINTTSRRVQRRPFASESFLKALAKAKEDENKIQKVGYHKKNKYCHVYNVMSAASKSIMYTVEIGLKQNCTCPWFLKNNTPWVLVFCLKAPEDSDLIYKMGLMVEEFDQINGKSRERSDNDSVSNKNGLN